MLFIEFFFDLLADILTDISDRHIRRDWKKHPIMMIFSILLIIGVFALTIFCACLIAGLSYLPFYKYGEILYLGKDDSILSTLLFGVTFIALIVIFALIGVGIYYIACKNKLKKKGFTEQEKGEKLTKKEKTVLVCAIMGFILVSLGIFYCYTYNTVVFTDNKIISTTFYNPRGSEYSYEDVKAVEIDNKDDANLYLTFSFDNNKKIDFSYSGDSYSDIEKYEDNDFIFVGDLVTRLRNDNVPITYKCTYDDVAQYCGEEHYKYLKVIFDE